MIDDESVQYIKNTLRHLRILRGFIEPSGAFELARARLVADIDVLFSAVMQGAPGAELKELSERLSQTLLDFGKATGQVVKAINPLFSGASLETKQISTN